MLFTLISWWRTPLMNNILCARWYVHQYIIGRWYYFLNVPSITLITAPTSSWRHLKLVMCLPIGFVISRWCILPSTDESFPRCHAMQSLLYIFILLRSMETFSPWTNLGMPCDSQRSNSWIISRTESLLCLHLASAQQSFTTNPSLCPSVLSTLQHLVAHPHKAPDLNNSTLTW